MYHTLFLKGEELAILGEMLHTQIADSHVELRHSKNIQFKEMANRRVEIEQLIADKIDLLLSDSADFSDPSQN